MNAIPEDVRRLANVSFDRRGRCVITPKDFEHFALLTFEAGYRQAEISQLRRDTGDDGHGSQS